MNSLVYMFFKVLSRIKNEYVRFLVIWIGSGVVYVMIYGLVSNAMPPRLDWISEYAMGIAFLAGFVTASISIREGSSQKTLRQILFNDSIITLLVGATLFLAYLLSFMVAPERYVTQDRLQEILSTTGLSPAQVQQVRVMIDAQSAVSRDDLNNLGLTDTQRNQVWSILQANGYTTKEDVVKIVRTEAVSMVTQTAIAIAAACQVTPEIGAVNVRRYPKPDGELIGALALGEEIHVIGSNGGRINQDLWWQVELNHGSKSVIGWVASWVVKEIHETECQRIPLAAGY